VFVWLLLRVHARSRREAAIRANGWVTRLARPPGVRVRVRCYAALEAEDDPPGPGMPGADALPPPPPNLAEPHHLVAFDLRVEGARGSAVVGSKARPPAWLVASLRQGRPPGVQIVAVSSLARWDEAEPRPGGGDPPAALARGAPTANESGTDRGSKAEATAGARRTS
jgi:hypothetical protein